MWDTTGMLPTRDEAIGQLDRVLASDVFASTSRLSRFLRFVAERSLAGESDRLKEYVIGVEVFDRDERYDPRVDSIVRVEAGRLRTKLEQYYHGPGRDDAIVIRMQKGSYAPSFERRADDAPKRALAAQATEQVTALADAATAGAPSAAVSESTAAAAVTHPRRPVRLIAAAAAGVLVAIGAAYATSVLWFAAPPANSIAVLPFEPHSDAPAEAGLAAQLTDGVTAELVRSGLFAVVPSRNAREAGSRGSVQSLARRLRASWLLEAQLVHDGASLRVEARLVDPAHNRKLWVDTFFGSVDDLDELSRRVAAGAVTARNEDERADR